MHQHKAVSVAFYAIDIAVKFCTVFYIHFHRTGCTFSVTGCYSECTVSVLCNELK